jgi:hypothetical protein
MDVLREFLDDLKRRGLTQAHFLGFLHVLIGRRIEKADGTLVANGLSWRDLAALLKRVRWDKMAVTEIGLNPADLPPRDRQRYWYMAIVQAKVDSPQAVQAGDLFAEQLRKVGYVVGAPPSTQ